MNEPIVSPWLIYWAGRTDMIHHFCIVAGVLLTMGAGISITGIVSNLDDCDSDDSGFGKAFLNFTKKLTCVTLIFDALASFIPTRDEAIAMYVAKNVLISGGSVSFDADWEANVEEGDWSIDRNRLAPELQDDWRELESLVNDEIPHGCCGGCI